MVEVEIERRLTEVDQRCKSNTRRLDKMEGALDALNKLATSVEVMTHKITDMDSSLQKLDARVEAQESKPGKRWDSLVSTIIGIVVGAIMALVFSKIGIPG